MMLWEVSTRFRFWCYKSCDTHTNGSDERMYIEQWFDRCYFSIMPEETFLSYLLEMREIDSVLECWEIL